MKHLINIKDLTIQEINEICLRANEFEKGIRSSNHSNCHVVNMFFENSTRTRLSFEMAQNRLHVNNYNFNQDTSSISKGENLFDTINNLSAIGMQAVILRHSDNDLIKKLSRNNYYNDISFINAGSGTNAHPTQALLDYYTMRKHFSTLSDKTITIVGDIAHSRVAKSNIMLLRKLGMKIRCLSNEKLMGKRYENVEYYTNLEEAFFNTDIIMALRIQKERINEEIDFYEYIKNYQITKENLPNNVLLMHPGPVNQDIEIRRDVLMSEKAQTILEQAKNGVYIRMAILDMILSNKRL